MTRYISTRGEAPALSFCDVMLTGLARDGGLYVPETWPHLAPDAIAALFGRPYWEVAVEIIKPFVGGEISDAELGRMANEAYATFRHPAVVPLDQMLKSYPFVESEEEVTTMGPLHVDPSGEVS